MKQLIVMVLAVHICCAATSVAGDYLLRVDTVGFAETPKSDTAPKETVLDRMETVVRPGTVFHSKVRIGMQTRLLHGELHPADDGKFEVRIRYVDTTDTGTTFVNEHGRVEPRVDKHSVSTTVSASPGVPVVLGGLDTESTTTTEAGEQTTVSKMSFVLNLTAYTKPLM